MEMITRRDKERGIALVISLMFLALLSMVGTTAYMMTTTDLSIGNNYQASAEAFSNADAGVNFALAEMLAGAKADPATFPSGGVAFSDMNIGDTTTLTYTVPSGFSFTISSVEKVDSDLYFFTSTGTGTSSAQSIIEIRFRPKRASLFNFGVFGDEWVTLRGQGYSDSYNSDNGPWVSEGQNTNGDIGTNATGAGVISIQGSNAQVYGGAQVGPGGDTSTDIVTHSSGQITGDKEVADEPKDMTCMTCPSGGTADTLSLTSWDTKTFNAGTYNLPSISIESHGVCTINGDVIFCVAGNISLTGQGEIIISPGASLKIYVSGAVNPLAGQGITNQTNVPANMQIYGTCSCTTVNISGQYAFYGAVYAPEADINLSGQGDVFGALCGDTIDMSGQGSVHYDEALGDITGDSITDMEILSWERQFSN